MGVCPGQALTFLKNLHPLGFQRGFGGSGGGGGGGTYVDMNATSPNITAGTDGGGTGMDGYVTICYVDPSDIAITNVSTTPETCAMGNDGTLTVTATSSNLPITYSIAGQSGGRAIVGLFAAFADEEGLI